MHNLLDFETPLRDNSGLAAGSPASVNASSLHRSRRKRLRKEEVGDFGVDGVHSTLSRSASLEQDVYTAGSTPTSVLLQGDKSPNESRRGGRSRFGVARIRRTNVIREDHEDIADGIVRGTREFPGDDIDELPNASRRGGRQRQGSTSRRSSFSQQQKQVTSAGLLNREGTSMTGNNASQSALQSNIVSGDGANPSGSEGKLQSDDLSQESTLFTGRGDPDLMTESFFEPKSSISRRKNLFSEFYGTEEQHTSASVSPELSHHHAMPLDSNSSLPPSLHLGNVKSNRHLSGYEPEMMSYGSLDEEAGDDTPYCYCRQPSYGQMIGCDNKNCKVEWFHYECVGLSGPPPETWFCRECAKKVHH
jgi:hypothetical protein